MCSLYCRDSSYSIPTLFILLRKLFTTSLWPNTKDSRRRGAFRSSPSILCRAVCCKDLLGPERRELYSEMQMYAHIQVKERKTIQKQTRITLRNTSHTQGKKKPARLFFCFSSPPSLSHKNEGIVGLCPLFIHLFPHSIESSVQMVTKEQQKRDGPVHRMFATRCLAANGTNSASF